MDEKSTMNGQVLPLKTLEEALNWTPDVTLKFRTEPVRPHQRDECAPKLLICHDMKGGYLEDRFVEGSSTSDGYRFFHWHLVDTFVYFSHHFITIPPVGWINAAHKHGVKVLGTVITEWESGSKICEDLLSCPEKATALIAILCAICKHFHFEGWLINIENRIQEQHVPALDDFLKRLKRSLEENVSGSMLIWYDSVLNTGELKWQNELNLLNRNYFDSSDGIFLNYNWTDKNLEGSLETAGDRKRDVYVGVDVFGRGCLGGGGFNTCEALESIKRFGLSVAIFAPGWVHEVHGADAFTDNQYKFWRLISKYFQTSKYCQIPFRSSFCQGFGQKLFKRGKVVQECAWYNLSAQEFQPTFDSMCDENSKCQTTIFTEEAYSGGGCLKVSGTLPPHCEKEYVRLFATHISIELSCLASLVWKCRRDTGVDLSLWMTFRDPQGQKIKCCGGDPGAGVNARLLRPLTSEEMERHHVNVQREECHTWKNRSFLIDQSDFCNYLLTEVGIRISRQTNVELDKLLHFTFLLGEFQIVPVPENCKKKIVGDV